MTSCGTLEQHREAVVKISAYIKRQSDKNVRKLCAVGATFDSFCPVGGDISSHVAALWEARFQHSTGGLPSEHCPELAQWIWKVARRNEGWREFRGNGLPLWPFKPFLFPVRCLAYLPLVCSTGNWAGYSEEATGASVRPSAMAGDGRRYDHGLRNVPKPDAGQEHQEQEAQRDFSEDSGRSR